jgi:hypothetical protein
MIPLRRYAGGVNLNQVRLTIRMMDLVAVGNFCISGWFIYDDPAAMLRPPWGIGGETPPSRQWRKPCPRCPESEPSSNY